MRKIKCIVLITVAVLVLGSTWVNAEYVYDPKETLRGIKGVEVVVEGLRPDAIKHGLTEETIQTDVELKLRLAGIKVLAQKERFNTPGSPCLYVNANLGLDGGLFFYSVKLSLEQKVYLVRDHKISCHATTWKKSSCGGVSSDRMSMGIREQIKGLVDIFINDYLEVNPIQPSKPKGK